MLPNRLTILICTHNRSVLLERTLASINAATRPKMPVQILVAANACSDDTVARMRHYQQQQASRDWLPLRVVEVPTPGKSHALNYAIPRLETELTAFVDDDHRVDPKYLVAIEAAADAWPGAGLYCGRILPDWDGSEPEWVHDDGPYRIYPLPVPRYDLGLRPKLVTAEEGPIPGGGNLVLRRETFAVAGEFSTDLGPHGHDLGGGEDSEYVLSAMARGVQCRYAPGIVQYHYVDAERLRLSYLLRKSFQRTRSTARVRGKGRVPLYMWRKLAEYGSQSLFSLGWPKRRFFMVRTAAALGEIQGLYESSNRGARLRLPMDQAGFRLRALSVFTVVCGIVAWFAGGADRWAALWPAALVAAVGAFGLVAKSISDFSTTGPKIRREILDRYRIYTLFSLLRLGAWVFVVMLLLAGSGILSYYALVVSIDGSWSPWGAVLFALLGIVGASAVQFIRALRFNPGLLVASMHYRVSRLYALWRAATPERLLWLQTALGFSAGALLAAATWRLAGAERLRELVALWAAALFYAGVVTLAVWRPRADESGRRSEAPSDARPNVLMIGSDTLRGDRLGVLGYRRTLSPNIDALAARGTVFSNCYVPCARTAPSLVSLLTGTWPQRHGIRDNYIPDSETKLKVPSLPQALKADGYRTAALSDWCGADMGKFSFGFEHTDLPEDQWNLKYLIRQGPKDLRLFLSLFLHNRVGRRLIPELYYLGGVPLTTAMGDAARRLVSRLSGDDRPFFLNVFFSTTHPPFASEWPWYTRFADPDYRGESKFAMARLTDPFEIIRRQGAPREEFDLDQIIDLYDGCVAHFDHEVGMLLRHVEACGLSDNTIIVIYSDHGMEFFEHETWGQGNSAIGDASPRIPLVIRDPRLPGRGVIDDVVRSIDVAPTLLDLVDVQVGEAMDGVSLAACIRGQEPCPQLDAFNETGIWIANIPGLPDTHLRYPDLLELIAVPDRESGALAIKEEYRDVVLNARDRMIRRGPWKLVWQPLSDGDRVLLFNLETDPGCIRDRSEDEPEIRESLLHTLRAWMASGR